jgi:hypothetical protein
VPRPAQFHFLWKVLHQLAVQLAFASMNDLGKQSDREQVPATAHHGYSVTEQNIDQCTTQGLTLTTFCSCLQALPLAPTQALVKL